MSNEIKLLPDYVANQIAAGEVVQRPSSVVKELLENSVDAKADCITLIVENAGRSLIQVEDNGKGMSTTDARLSFERHATSKIRNTEDIFRILTKGFRGEALASIAAVARVEMMTAREKDSVGVHIVMEGGKFKQQEAIATPVGTIISVRNLFFNVPARRSFLKSDQVEFRNILDEYHRLVLSHPEIEFKLLHNKSLVYHNRKGSFLQRILQIFGVKQEKYLTPIEEKTDLVEINGFVGKPDLSKKNKGLQFFFINNRYIKSPILHKAILQAYGDLLPYKHHPAYFINLKMDPEKIDINIHPTKTEVKFLEEQTLFAVLNATVKRSLGKFQLMDAIDFDTKNHMDFPSFFVPKNLNPNIKIDRDFNPFKTENIHKKVDADYLNEIYNLNTDKYNKEDTEAIDFFEKENKLEFLYFEKGLILVNYESNLVLVNQNRAHQTLLYLDFTKKFRQNNISQQLLFPIEISINPYDIFELKTFEKDLVGIGFDFSIENDCLKINAVPSVMKTEQVEDFFEELLTFDKEFTKTNLENDLQNGLAKVLAKVCAVKRSEILTKEQIKNLLERFFDLEQNQFSPFGKINYNKIDLDSVTKNLF